MRSAIMQVEGELMQTYSANMQRPNWNDLRYLLAVQRGQMLCAAARQLQVDDTTVSRRLASLERELGRQLVRRRGDARLELTEAGERIAQDAEAMETHYAAISSTVGGNGDICAGTVRLTTVPILSNRVFAHNFDKLAATHPGIVLELIPDSRALNLTRREADVAVRLARPSTGGMAVKAHRIGILTYAAYAQRQLPFRRIESLPWITYEETMSNLPQARWMMRAAQTDRVGQSSLRVHDAETALEGAAAGLGKTLLPILAADGDPRLRRISMPAARSLPARPIWLLAHADQVGLNRVATVIDWVKKTVVSSSRK
jgi:DNA-binding transcriptional LysR family regulator